MAVDRPKVKKALLLAPRMEPRGTSEYVLNLARELDALGVEVAVCCAPGPVVDSVRGAGLTVHVFDHLQDLRFRPGERRRLLAAAQEHEPQVVHCQGFRVVGALKLLSRHVRAPFVLTAHWVPERARGLRRLWRRLAGVIASTQAVRECLVNQCRVPREKVRCIRNGVDLERLDARRVPPAFGGRVPVVGSVGPIEERRGHELFVRAASLLAARGLRAQYVVAGQGSGLRSLRKLVADLGLERSVTLATDFTSYEDVLGAIDVVVQSSQVDVSGFSILEAMGHGRPVIAFNTGTACEIVEDCRTGLLVPKGDARALAEAIVQILGAPDAARRMGENARARVRELFNVHTLARETLDYYEGVVGNGG